MDRPCASASERRHSRRLALQRADSLVDSWGTLSLHCTSTVSSSASLEPFSRSRNRVNPRPDSSLSVQLLEPIKAVSPGQAVVLYDGSWCLGGGTIDATRTLADTPQ